MEQHTYEYALGRFTRNREHVHELFIMASNRPPQDPIYVECSPGGTYNIAFGELYSDDFLSENIFLMMPRYRPDQLQYIHEHRGCSYEEIPGFMEMIERMHTHLQKRIEERQEKKRRHLLEEAHPTTKRRVETLDDRIFLRAITGSDTHRLLS